MIVKNLKENGYIMIHIHNSVLQPVKSHVSKGTLMTWETAQCVMSRFTKKIGMYVISMVTSLQRHIDRARWTNRNTAVRWACR